MHPAKTQLTGDKRRSLGMQVYEGKKSATAVYNEQIAAMNTEDLFNYENKVFISRNKISKAASEVHTRKQLHSDPLLSVYYLHISTLITYPHENLPRYIRELDMVNKLIFSF